MRKPAVYMNADTLVETCGLCHLTQFHADPELTDLTGSPECLVDLGDGREESCVAARPIFLQHAQALVPVVPAAVGVAHKDLVNSVLD